MQATVPGGLRPRGDPALVEQPLGLVGRFLHHRERHAGRRVEVDAQLVGVIRVGGEVRPHVEAEAAHVHGPQDVRHVGNDQRVRLRAVRRAHERRLQPVGRFLADALLEERLVPGAVRVALHQRRPALHRAHQRRLDRQVVLRQVELGRLDRREEDLVGVRDANHAPRRLELDGGVVLLRHGVEATTGWREPASARG